MSIPYKAVGDHVVVELKVEEKTKSGIYLPMNEDKKENMNKTVTVMSVGDSCTKGLKVGDVVFLKNSFGVPLPFLDDGEHKGKNYLAIEEKAVVAIKK